MTVGQTYLPGLRRLAFLNGGSVAAIALLGAIACGILGFGWGVVIGLLFAIAGAIEIRGGMLLATNVNKARYWLCGAQLYFLLVIIAYAGWRLVNLNLDPAALLKAMGFEMVDRIKVGIHELYGIWLPDQVLGNMLADVLPTVYWALIIASLIYQGLMFSWYYRKLR